MEVGWVCAIKVCRYMEAVEHFVREVVSVYGGRLVSYTPRYSSLSRLSQNANDICGAGHKLTDIGVVGGK